MATQLFLRVEVADCHLGHNNTTLIGTGVGWLPRTLATTRGSGVAASTDTSTVAGTTPGVDVWGTAGAIPLEWISPPIATDVTISGTITANIWASENGMNANVAINVVIEIIRATDNSLVQIVKSTRNTEVALTTRAVANFTTGMTSGSYTAQTVNRGDRIRIRVFGDDSGTMGAGFTFNIGYSGNTAAADGDSYVTFTEDFTFESAPAGTTIYLTDTASDVATASVDREAWTSRGAGVTSDVTNTAAGWTTPIQVTDTAGGTVVDWFTKPLAAVTLEGMVLANLRALQSAGTANASLKCEIALVDGDGTNPTVWGSWCIESDANQGELTTTESAREAWVSGDSLAISNGQRLRIRVYIDDYAAAAMGSGQTVTLFYAGTSGGASGDSFLTFPVTLSEAAAAAPGPVWRRRPAHRFLTMR